jgi:hypothetical protein
MCVCVCVCVLLVVDMLIRLYLHLLCDVHVAWVCLVTVSGCLNELTQYNVDLSICLYISVFLSLVGTVLVRVH